MKNNKIYDTENYLCVNCARIQSKTEHGENYCHYYRKEAFKIKVEAFENSGTPIECYKYKALR